MEAPAQMFQPKLSVVTIVYNNVQDIGRTLRSVIDQTYPNIEYIVVDGASTDGTFEILEKNRSQIDLLISEKDKGIYDAMNKGLSKCTGDYVIFMNSGDEFFSLETVAQVFATQPTRADIYYGETVLIDDRGQTLGYRKHRAPKNFDWRSFRFGMNVGHQAIYIKRSITEPYQEKYQLSADVDWIIRAAKKAKTSVNVDMKVAKFLVGGVSKKRKRQSLKERYQILSAHYGWLNNLFNHGLITMRWLAQKFTNKTKY